jgi:hypothetical protein
LNGDVVITPKGETVRKPVAMKDAHRVAVDLLNQKDAIEKAMSKEPGAEGEGSTDKLEVLAERFAMFATKKIEQSLDKKRTVEVTDVIYVETSPAGESGVAPMEQALWSSEGDAPTGSDSVDQEGVSGTPSK